MTSAIGGRGGTATSLGRFVEAVHARHGMRPVVPLDLPMEIGDIGTITGEGQWRPVTTVRHRFRSVPGRVKRTSDGAGTWELSSGRDVVFTTYARGETSALVPLAHNARARAEIELATPHAFLLSASDVSFRVAHDLGDLIDKIRLAYHLRRTRPEDGRWWTDFRFVFAVADARCYTAMLADGMPTTVSVTSRGPFPPPAALADLGSGVDVGVWSERFQCVNQRDAQGFLYRAYRLRAEVLERWREEPWSKARGVITFHAPVPSFEETFVEV